MRRLPKILVKLPTAKSVSTVPTKLNQKMACDTHTGNQARQGRAAGGYSEQAAGASCQPAKATHQNWDEPPDKTERSHAHAHTGIKAVMKQEN